MRRFVLALLVLSLSSVMVDRAHSSGSSVVGILNEVGGSGVTGKVSLRSLSRGGTRIALRVEGLQFDVEYVSIYASNGSCDLEVNSMSRVLARYRGNKRGGASLTVDVADSIDQIHSVSVRLGYRLALVSCASLN